MCSSTTGTLIIFLCDSRRTAHYFPTGARFRVLYSQLRNSLMFDELWSEIADAPGEIFDVIDFKEEWEQEEKFDVEKHINGNIEF